MGAYFAMRIEQRKLDYNTVVEKFPEFKEDIDLNLIVDGYEVKPDGTVVKSTV